ncbi:MAG: hypothetical protein E4G90_09910 [Gemmatimonadales bacterium]|nr:MAG: hypothetical protein E4G90_09910 [Gemmatimonadales bacterium]
MSGIEARAAKAWAQNFTMQVRVNLSSLSQSGAQSVPNFDYLFAKQVADLICETGKFGPPVAPHPWAAKSGVRKKAK